MGVLHALSVNRAQWTRKGPAVGASAIHFQLGILITRRVAARGRRVSHEVRRAIFHFFLRRIGQHFIHANARLLPDPGNDLFRLVPFALQKLRLKNINSLLSYSHSNFFRHEVRPATCTVYGHLPLIK